MAGCCGCVNPGVDTTLLHKDNSALNSPRPNWNDGWLSFAGTKLIDDWPGFAGTKLINDWLSFAGTKLIDDWLNVPNLADLRFAWCGRWTLADGAPHQLRQNA